MHKTTWFKLSIAPDLGERVRRVRAPALQRCFHASRRRQDGLLNHYETLGVPPNATDKEIKKQFYALSKKYHPDLHPDDPNASKRFVQISEAYAVLSSSDKRHIYDRDFARAHQPASNGPAYPSGSFSSASTPAGGRPASGLSRRRTQFRGPPPSFYQSGGWGEQSTKRAEYASQSSHGWEGQATNDGSVGSGQGMPGTGPGGFAQGLENDVPHFDSRGHYQTHSTIERTRHKARRRVYREADGASDAAAGRGTLFGFVMVSGMLGFGIFLTNAITGRTQPKSRVAISEDRM